MASPLLVHEKNYSADSNQSAAMRRTYSHFVSHLILIKSTEFKNFLVSDKVLVQHSLSIQATFVGHKFATLFRQY